MNEQIESEKIQIKTLPINMIDDFEGHPFRVLDDEDMRALTESIAEHGLLTPLTVRQKEDGRYEMISGHRRKRACELLGMETVRAIVAEMTREEAIITMVDSNVQRSRILPSEKAFAYRMKMDAMKRQGTRTDLTSPPLGTKLPKGDSRPLGTKLDSAAEIAEKDGENRRNVYRYIRLTYLIRPFLDSVDTGEIKLQTAVELSFLPEEVQETVWTCFEEASAHPSYSQASSIRKKYESGGLDREVIDKIISGSEKPIKHYTFKYETLKSLIPCDYTPTMAEDYVVKALEFYKKYLQKQRENSR